MFAVTERLLLRPGWPDDAPMLARAFAEPSVAGTFAWTAWTCPPDDTARWLTLPHAPLRPRFLIARRDSAELVGTIGFVGEDAPEFGCWIASSCRGRGFGAEAAGAAMALADHSLRFARVLTRRVDDDPASTRLLARLGFTGVGDGTENTGIGGGELAPVRLLARRRFGAAPVLLAA